MLVAIYHHVLVAGFSIPYLELSALYAACFLFYLVNGGGLFSADALIAGWLNAVSRSQHDQQIESLQTSYKSSEAATK